VRCCTSLLSLSSFADLPPFSGHFSLFVAGWGDASSGPLIPYIQVRFSLPSAFQKIVVDLPFSFSPRFCSFPAHFAQEHYHISYTIVSMLFIGQMVGFLVASLVASWLNTRFGLVPYFSSFPSYTADFFEGEQGKVIVLGACFQMTAYGLLIAAFPFPVFPILYAWGGFGLALQDAMANTYIAALPVRAEQKLSYLHASYGLVGSFLSSFFVLKLTLFQGAAVCPLAATGFVSSGILFARFYSISCGIAALNVVLLA
jgi:hypothetical protein